VSAPADAPSSQASTNLQGQLAIDYLKEHGIYDRLSASIEQAEYEIDRGLRSLGERGQSDEEVYAATNRAQNLRAQFSGGEVLLQPSQADRRGAMKLRLKLQDYGYAGRMLTPGPEVMRVDGNRVEITREIAGEGQARREEITEWYRNRKEGIEQGFTLTAPPGEREVGQPLRVRMKVTGKVRLAPVDSGKAVELRSADGKVSLRYDHLLAMDALGRELPARIEPRRQEISLVIEDVNAVYPVQIDPLFTQTKKLTAGDAAPGDAFREVGISGDTVVVGAPFKNDSTGAAYVFGRNQGGAGNWGQVKKLTAGDAGPSQDFFGISVGIGGDTVVVGAIGKNLRTGAAYVFGRNQGGADNWGQVKKLTAGDAAVADEFGRSVGISGDAVVVGASNKDSGTGAAYIFGRTQGGVGNWGQVKKLTAGDGTTFDTFGISVGISGDTVVVGAVMFGGEGAARPGAAYVFGRTQGGADNWGQVKKLTAGDAAPGDQFGWSVGISGDTVVVGARAKAGTPVVGQSAGAAYIFGRNQGGPDNWGQVQKLTASDAAQNDGFGNSVGIGGDTVVVGAIGRNSSTGAAYIFGRNHGGADNWGQVQILTAGDATTGDTFGNSVGISGGTVVVGAGNKDSNTGAVYIFDLTYPPTITKQFGGSSIPLNGTTSLTFTINNPNAATTLNGIGFSDTLPAGLVVSTPNGLTGSCGGGAITATAGSGSISLLGASLAASTQCTFSVNVTGITAGLQNNTTGSVTSTNGGPGGTASASVIVCSTLTIVCPGSITRFADSGQFGATINPGTPVTSGGCSPVTITGVRSDGRPLNALYPIGVTMITWTAKGANGDTAICAQSIAVMVSSGKRRHPSLQN
jgi:hypothetical protein